jgi:hypothetical protein
MSRGFSNGGEVPINPSRVELSMIRRPRYKKLMYADDALRLHETALNCDKNTTAFLISCTQKKVDHPAEARALYASSTFRASIEFCELHSLTYFIISAKHGLLKKDNLIEPYDLSLKNLTREKRNSWAIDILQKLNSKGITTVVALAGADYYKPLMRFYSVSGLINFMIPMRHLSLGFRTPFLRASSNIYKRKEAIQALYNAFPSDDSRVQVFQFGNFPSITIPTKGVYIFFDPSENSIFQTKYGRVVRIGTHGVSIGSRSTLRSRLRAHFGTGTGGGNHRASVFRLHVGQAIAEAEGITALFPNWAVGESAGKETTNSESALELKVSKYIRAMYCAVIPVDDESSVSSLRAQLERYLITLFTEHHIYIDTPEKNWLGCLSVKPSIAKSGLWNIRHVGDQIEGPLIESADDLFTQSAHELIRSLFTKQDHVN